MTNIYICIKAHNTIIINTFLDSLFSLIYPQHYQPTKGKLYIPNIPARICIKVMIDSFFENLNIISNIGDIVRRPKRFFFFRFYFHTIYSRI